MMKVGEKLDKSLVVICTYFAQIVDLIINYNKFLNEG